MCVFYLAGQLCVLHETTAAGFGKSLHSESSTNTSSPSVSKAQYSTLVATPPPHVTLQTPCWERHLVVTEDMRQTALKKKNCIQNCAFQVCCLTLEGRVMYYTAQNKEEVWQKCHSWSQAPPVWSDAPHRKTTPAGFLHKHQAFVDFICRDDAVSQWRCVHVLLTVVTGFWALTDHRTPYIHGSLSGPWHQTRLQCRLILVNKNSAQIRFSVLKTSERFISLVLFTCPVDSHPIGQTSTTQGTESDGLISFEQKLWSTSTSWPSSGRTHDTKRFASPGPHTAEHSPGSDTCHL